MGLFHRPKREDGPLTLEQLKAKSFKRRYFKECGFYSQKFAEGQIPDDELDIEKIAYTKDNLYNIIADAVGKLQANHPELIPYKKNDAILR